MATVLDELEELRQQEKRLAAKRTELMQRRRHEIGDLFAELDMLGLDDAIIRGLLIELKALPATDPRLGELRDRGAPAKQRRARVKTGDAAAA